MKHTLFILALLTASIQTFAQSPRIKLNQITKDSVTGSVLISSPTDSGMVYSRDLFISYGADTVLILYGDTISGGGGLSSVLSDGVTITGDGTTGNELKVDTSTVISTIQGLVDSLTNYVTTNTTQTISGAKTFTAAFTQSGGDANFDSGTLFVDATNNNVGIGTTNITDEQGFGRALEISAPLYGGILYLRKSGSGSYSYFGYDDSSLSASYGAYGTNTKLKFIVGTGAGGNNPVKMILYSSGNLALGLPSDTIPSENLDVNGNGRFRSIGSGASAGALHYTSTGVLTTNTSDVRLKTNLQPLENTLNKLLEINTYTFNWIDETDRVDLGMVAQEVEQIFPNLVFTNSVDGYKGIHYDKFSSILTKAIQEQQAIIETQEQKITDLETTIQSLITRIENLENK